MANIIINSSHMVSYLLFILHWWMKLIAKSQLVVNLFLKSVSNFEYVILGSWTKWIYCEEAIIYTRQFVLYVSILVIFLDTVSILPLKRSEALEAFSRHNVTYVINKWKSRDQSHVPCTWGGWLSCYVVRLVVFEPPRSVCFIY